MGHRTDFTTGNITTQLIAFSIPLVFGELLQNLYHSVDAWVVGNMVSDTALGAVSVCATLVNLVVGFFNGMSVGTTVIIARIFGEKNDEKLIRSVQITFTFSAMLGAALSVVGLWGTKFLIGLSSVPADIYAEAVTYLRIYMAGLIFSVIYNNGAGILRAIGDTKTPFIILSISGAVNVILDIAFVAVFHLGVAGVGYATVIAQFVSVAIVYRLIKHKYQANCLVFWKSLRDRWTIIREVVEIGIPSGMQGALIAFSNLFIWRYVNQFGAAATAGIGIAQRLDKFVGLPCKSLGITATTFVSQNLGAGKDTRIREGIKRCFALSLTVTLALELVVYSFAEECVSLFNDNPEIISIGVDMIRVIIPLYFLMAVREVLLGVLRGHGYTRVALILTLLGMIGVRQLYLWAAMAQNADITNIYMCYPLAWGSATLLLLVYYLFVKRNFWEEKIKNPPHYN